jgi:outer membrane protein assembly factor BamB
MIAGVARMQSVGTILSSPVIAGRVVYFGSNDGNLYALR